MERQTRHLIDTAFRAEGDSELPVISGYASVFNTRYDLGMFTESVAPGAFVDSIARGDDVRALIDHDPKLIIGRNKAGTLELREDERGLFYSVKPVRTQRALDLIVDIRAGHISQSSFGFIIEREEVDTSGDRPHFTIKQARLFDVSPVTYPASPSTEVKVEARSLADRVKAAARISSNPAIAKEHRERCLKVLRLFS